MKTWIPLLIFCGLIFGCSLGHDPESAAAKHENSVLEAVSAQGEETHITGLELRDVEDYHFASVPSNGHRIWVMLNPENEPYYKQMPKGDFSLSRMDFEAIEKSHQASLTVLSCLESHISEK